MKTIQKIIFIGLLLIINVIIGLLIFNKNNQKSVLEADSDHSKTTSVELKEKKETTQNKEEKEKTEIIEEPKVIQEEVAVVEADPIVYDGLTLEELTNKIERSLNSNLIGSAQIFVNHSLELGVDPYLATAIAMHETGCNWECSRLVKECNNVGGQKGSGCNGYQYFNTLEEGITGFIDNIYYNYYLYGLTTPETMNPKYAESTTWATQVNNYINTIKAS